MSLYLDMQDRLDGVVVYGGYFMCLCPFHDDHTPSFMVHEDERYFCKTCRVSGTLDYLERRLGKRFDPTKPRKIVEKKFNLLPRWRKWEGQWGDLHGIAQAAHEFGLEFPALRSYFVQRGIGQYYRLGMFGWLDDWNLFPVIDSSGNVVDIVARGKGANRYAIVGRNEVPPLYSPDWNRVMESDTVYVPFGIIDSWALHDSDLPTCTGITGQSVNADLLYQLDKKSYIIVPDYGEDEQAWKLKIRLGYRAKVMELDYPYGTKDPDDIWRTLGKPTLLRMLGVENA